MEQGVGGARRSGWGKKEVGGQGKWVGKESGGTNIGV